MPGTGPGSDSADSQSERNPVILGVKIGQRLRRRLLWGRLLWSPLLLRPWRLVGAVLVLWSAPQQLHGALHVYDNFCRVTLDTVLLPFAGLQLAFDVDL